MKLSGTYASWTKDEKAQAELVCHTYSFLGEMIHYGHVNPAVALQWADSIDKSWNKLKPMFDATRPMRDENHWKGFDYLVELLRKHRKVLHKDSVLAGYEKLSE